MKKCSLFFLIFVSLHAAAQPLTVEKIMRDSKWIGTSPSNISWYYNSKQILFNWNPEKAAADSTYSFEINTKEPVKLKYHDAGFEKAISAGTYNLAKNKIAFIFNDDLYLLDVATGESKRITQTDEAENNPSFCMHDEWVAYQSGDNLFAWNIASGITKQLTDFEKEKPAAKKLNRQDEWLQQDQLQTSDIIKQRKEKTDARKKYLQQVKDADSIHIIYRGDKSVQSLQVDPSGRFITYNLFEDADNAKNTVVPAYITQSGYTTDIPGRTNVGAPQGKYRFFVFDRIKDTVIEINMDSLPGIKDRADYMKDYPSKFKDTLLRDVIVYGCSWNDEGTAAVIDIRAKDNKDRWLMQLDAASGKLKLMDRQRDEAWIAGPGIDDYFSEGWINDHVFYFQSEASGYSHLYSFDINTQTKKTITQGNYEVQFAKLSNDKKYFYIITNEENLGKQNFYRISIDGSNKQKITSMDGGYTVSISPDEKNIAYRYSYQNKPWELYVQPITPGAKPVQVTHLAMSDEFRSYPWRDAKIFTFAARDGAQVYARIYQPSKEKKNNAAVIFVHGAGYLQNVDYWWSYYFREMMFNNLLADKGYTVMDIDYRGSAGYGRNWRTGIYRYMGGKDLNDEMDAAKFLVQQYGIDASRIGMYGGSYGGFMTLMALFTQPDVIKAGAALRPVTDWSHYNHEYTSDILNEPFNDSIAYRRSSPVNFASGLKNHLLICHGMVDENVHYQDAVRLAQRLIELGKDNWELASYPVEDHGFVEPSSWTDEYKRILKLFDDNLLKP